MIGLKLLVRAALRIQRAYETHRLRPDDEMTSLLARLDDEVDALHRTFEQLVHVQARGWPTATGERSAELLARVDSVSDVAHLTRSLLSNRPAQPPTLTSLMQELRQLRAEFADFDIDFAKGRLSVITEPIELDGVYLGPFAVQLRWSELAHGSFRSSLAVVALDPHPAATNDSVTHPHVRDEVLCAGDATLPLERALRDGRLADACLLVRGVLTTYNDDSPHVPLKEWYGGTCAECGAGLNTDCANYCDGCNSDCCDDCYRFCEDCEIGRCVGCLGSCVECEKRICGHCQHYVLKRGVFCESCHDNLAAPESNSTQVHSEPALAAD